MKLTAFTYFVLFLSSASAMRSRKEENSSSLASLVPASSQRSFDSETTCEFAQDLDISFIEGFYSILTNSTGIDVAGNPDIVALVQRINGTVGSRADYYSCTYELNRKEVAAVAFCDSADIPASCVTVVEYEGSACASAEYCADNMNFSADCSGISSDHPDCKLDCGSGIDSCSSGDEPVRDGGTSGGHIGARCGMTLLVVSASLMVFSI